MLIKNWKNFKILESKIDKDYLFDIFSGIEDELDINFNIEEGYFSEEGLKGLKDTIRTPYLHTLNPNKSYKSDKYCYRIRIGYKSLKTMNSGEEYVSPFIQMDSFSKLISELNKISKFFDESYIMFINGYAQQIEGLFLIEDDSEESEIYRKYLEIKTCINALKSDFGYNTVVKFEDDKIIIKSDSDTYTDRKLNSAIRHVDISNLKRDKREEDREVFITFTIKTS